MHVGMCVHMGAQKHCVSVPLGSCTAGKPVSMEHTPCSFSDKLTWGTHTGDGKAQVLGKQDLKSGKCWGRGRVGAEGELG